jgi:hypothetical protein
MLLLSASSLHCVVNLLSDSHWPAFLRTLIYKLLHSLPSRTLFFLYQILAFPLYLGGTLILASIVFLVPPVECGATFIC